MKNNQILTKAIKKAIKNGLYWKDGYDEVELMFENPYELIFSHDFAKAFWKNTNHMGETGRGPDFSNGWEFHLRQAVVHEDPLQYIKDYL